MSNQSAHNFALAHSQNASCEPNYLRLSPKEWREERDRCRSRISSWVDDYTRRSSRAEKHPVFDFLFTYYSYKPAHLLRWSPGFSCSLLESSRDELDWPEYYDGSDGELKITLRKFPRQRLESFYWIVDYLRLTGQRAPVFSCFGLHEWAMIYDDGELRHDLPLRLPRSQIVNLLDKLSLRCSHFDAFRFFTPSARPKNCTSLNRASVIDHDQLGCVHVSMDLYRYAFKFAPFISSATVIDAFLLACEARVLDMRASPYDLSSYGFAPIRIEEQSGREEYVKLQRAVSEKAKPIRAKLLWEYQTLKDALSQAE